MITDIRQAHGMAHFHFEDEDLIVSTQFSVIESHAYAETEEEKLQMKVRNIFNGRILNGLAGKFFDLHSHSHADIAAILGHWSAVMTFPEVRRSAFKAGRPILRLHTSRCLSSHSSDVFALFIMTMKRQVRYGFYRALPFDLVSLRRNGARRARLCPSAAVILCMI